MVPASPQKSVAKLRQPMERTQLGRRAGPSIVHFEIDATDRWLFAAGGGSDWRDCTGSATLEQQGRRERMFTLAHRVVRLPIQ